MADAARKIAGFSELSLGINNGISPNLLEADQAFNAVNVSFRGDTPTTRDPWINHILNNPPATWTGIFQGSMHYDGEAGQSGWLVARGGHFFFITDDTFTMSDVTPSLNIVTTGDFILPGINNLITVNFNGNPPVITGNTVTLGGYQFAVSAVFIGQLQLKQLGATVGTTAGTFTQPLVGAQVTVPVASSAWAHVGQPILMVTGGYYHIASIPVGGISLILTNDGAAGNAAPGTVIPSLRLITPGIQSGTPLFDSTGTNQSFETVIYPSTLNFVYMFQAENYGIVLGGQEKTLIWDGKQMRPSNPAANEIPSGFLGAYGWGRIWICLPDRRTFVAGDIVFGPSGTAQNGFRDAILKFTENTFLNEGGSFGVPYNAGPITAMQFLATQDTSLGVGVLLVGTTNMVFSVNAPTDRTTWKNLTYPIQTVSLIDYGPQGPRSAVPVNGDMWYRSLDGVRSFVVARRQFPLPGNTPMSHEMPILDVDTPNLMFFGSGVFFDNRLFFTLSPMSDVNGQITHRGLAIMNFDLVSDLRQKQSPCWEGIYTGLNICQIDKARVNNDERNFVWAQGPSDIELWEILNDGISDEYSTVTVGGLRGVTRSLGAGTVSIATKAIQAMMETRAEDYGFPLELKRLIMGELYIEDVADSITVAIFYKPDSYPNWIPWQTFTICADVSQCTPNVNGCIFQVNARTYAARITLPQPPDACNGMTSKPLREFHDCQFRLLWTGHCTFRRFFTHIKIQTQATEGSCPPTVTCVAFPFCEDNLFTYDSHS